jgi:DNA-binding transcriptional LysR family regulator
MDMLSITYFVAAAENLSFTVAARNLYVSQPSISKKVAELEAELGLLLFQRSGKAIQLTAAGRQLYFDFRTLLQFFDDITTHAKDIGNSKTGVIRIGAPQYMDLSRTIPGFFNNFYHCNPGIKIILLYEGRKTLITNFLEGNVDCSFFLSYDAENLKKELPLRKFDLPKGPHRLLYSPSLFPEGYQPAIDDFQDKPFVFFKDNSKDYTVAGKIDEVLAEIRFMPNNLIMVDSWDTMLLYVTEKIGVTIVGPSYRVERSDKIQWISLTNKKSMVGLCLCWKENNTNSALLSFVDALEEWCKKV